MPGTRTAKTRQGEPRLAPGPVFAGTGLIAEVVPPVAPAAHRSPLDSTSLADHLLVADAWHSLVGRLLSERSRVLEAGCGSGELARGLIYHPYVQKYIGFDLLKPRVDWCTQSIVPRIGDRFEFHHVDVFDRAINTSGRIRGTEVVFPARDQTIDLAVARSVFIHLQEPDVRHWLGEFRRVLGPRGLFLSSVPAAGHPGTETPIAVSPDKFVELAQEAGLELVARLGCIGSREAVLFRSKKAANAGIEEEDVPGAAVLRPMHPIGPASPAADHDRAGRSSKTLETIGGIHSATVEGRELLIRGWALGKDGEPVDGFTLRCGEKEMVRCELLNHLPSPDVVAAYPSFGTASHCGFRLRAHLSPAELAVARSSLIRCTPQVQDKEGWSLIHVIESELPMPGPEQIARIGDGDFLKISSQFLTYFIHAGGLKPASDVLDVGSGLARMAYSLVYFLEPTARYEGFDIVASQVEWAERTISSRFPNFHFQHADIYNKWYNPAGVFQGLEYRFPYGDESFDFVFLTSVFTHMLAPDVRHYLDEFQRVLRPGGRCFTTCFLLNDESEALIRAGKSTQPLVHRHDECVVTDPEYPEYVTGYKESLLLGWIAERGFRLDGTYYGAWCGRSRFTSYQDILVYTKPPA